MTKTSTCMLKLLISIASAFGMVQVWFITRAAILGRYSWCGTGRLIRQRQVSLYLLLLGLPALITVVKTWKNRSKMDYFTKVTCLSFLAAIVLYWFFER